MAGATIRQTTNAEPSFTWQVGKLLPQTSLDGVTFRATVRKLTSFEDVSRIPNEDASYEESGILLDTTTNMGNWTFTIDKNSSISDGPYRDYQVVIEAHDVNGDTSAGNKLGTITGENNWTMYPYGYDMLAIKNPRITGIELSDNIPTQFDTAGPYLPAVGSTYNSEQFMGTNGEVIIRFKDSEFPSDAVGGYIYACSTQFPKSGCIDSSSSYWGSNIQKTRFDFNSTNPYIYSPTAASKFRGSPYIYISVSFFDELDRLIIEKGSDISNSLYISNNSMCFSNAYAGTVTVGDGIGSGNVTVSTLVITGWPPANYISGTYSGIELGRFSTNGQSNTVDNKTTIFYITMPNAVPAIATPTTLDGFWSGTYLLKSPTVGSPVWTAIKDLNVGDYVYGPKCNTAVVGSSPFNPFIDNWNGCQFYIASPSLAPDSTYRNRITRLETGLCNMIAIGSGVDTHQRLNDYVVGNLVNSNTVEDLNTPTLICSTGQIVGYLPRHIFGGFVRASDIGNTWNLSEGPSSPETPMYSIGKFAGGGSGYTIALKSGYKSLGTMVGYRIEVSNYKTFWIALPGSGSPMSGTAYNSNASFPIHWGHNSTWN